MPSTNTIGKNTATVVSVEAITAPLTSRVPRTAAVTMSSPSSRQRKMDSSTTIEQSTSMPTPSASPPSDMMLSETPIRLSGAKVINSDIGMLTPMMAVVLRSAEEQVEDRHRQQATQDRRVLRTSLMLLSMNFERSATISSLAPSSPAKPLRQTVSCRPIPGGPNWASGSPPAARWTILPTASVTALATATMLASASL